MKINNYEAICQFSFLTVTHNILLVTSETLFGSNCAGNFPEIECLVQKFN